MPSPNIDHALELLAQRRPVFHSEADFQHALAWEFQLMDPTTNIRLEKQIAAAGSRIHLDLLAQGAGYEVAIEVKYKTKAVEIVHCNEIFSLRNQRAQDIGRHDFVKDIGRLEKYTDSHPGSIGYAILLTNDRTYWLASQKLAAVDSEFRIHEDRVMEGSLAWSSRASEGTKRNRNAAIELQCGYKPKWRDFSIVGVDHSEKFRYLALKVPSEG